MIRSGSRPNSSVKRPVYKLIGHHSSPRSFRRSARVHGFLRSAVPERWDWSGHGVPPASRDNRELASTVIKVQTGYPFMPQMAVNSLNNRGDQLPDRVANRSLPANQRSYRDWFNTNLDPPDPARAFAIPALYQYGNSGFDILRGPGLAVCRRSRGPAILGWRTSAPSNAPRCVQSPEPDESRTTQLGPGCRIRRRHQSYLDVRAPTRGAGPRGAVRSL